MIQIDFFDSDVLNTLVPIHTMAPDTVYFLSDKKNVTDRQISNAIKAIQLWKPETKVYTKDVDIDKINEIRAALDEIRRDVRDEQVYLDLTGGTELMSVCGYEFCQKYNATPIYMDAKKEHIIDVLTGEKIQEVKHIQVSDYITAIGAKRLEDSHELPSPNEFDRICQMAEVLFANTNEWNELATLLAKQYKDTAGYMEAVIPLKYSRLEYVKMTGLIDAFERYGFWKKTGRNTYRYMNHKYQDYMITYGIWLEMYIYIKAREVFDESCLGLVLDWNALDTKDTEDNEIDVVVMRQSRPIFISCKMRKPEAPDVYEVGYLAGRLGGMRAKACVATTFQVREKGNAPKGIYQRFKKMHIGVIETADFGKRKAHEVFNNAIQMTE